MVITTDDQQGPSDRRAVLISLTQQGWAVVRASLGVIAALEEEWTRELGVEETNRLRETLGKLGRTAGS